MLDTVSVRTFRHDHRHFTGLPKTRVSTCAPLETLRCRARCEARALIARLLNPNIYSPCNFKECFSDNPVPFLHSTLISLDFEFSKTRNLPTVSSINERRVSKRNKNMLKARFRPRAVSSVRLAEA